MILMTFMASYDIDDIMTMAVIIVNLEIVIVDRSCLPGYRRRPFYRSVNAAKGIHTDFWYIYALSVLSLRIRTAA